MYFTKPFTLYRILLFITIFIGILVFMSIIGSTFYGLCQLYLKINNFSSKKAVLTNKTKYEKHLPLYCSDTSYSSQRCYCKTHVICKLFFEDILITVDEYYNLSPTSKHICPSERSIESSCNYSLYSSMLIFYDKNLNIWSFSDNSFAFTIYSIVIIFSLIIFLVFLFILFYCIFLCANHIFNLLLNIPSNISLHYNLPNVPISQHLSSI